MQKYFAFKKVLCTFASDLKTKTNIMNSDLKQYETQINEIANFAKKINYNIENGIEELMRLWLKDGIKFQNFVKDNKDDFIRTTKQFLN